MPETGPSIDGVNVRRRLAVGGMAEVFLADQTLEDGGQRVVVIKQLLPAADDLWRSLFARERQALAAIDSPYVVKLLGATEEHLLLEYIDGPDLGSLLRWLGKRGRSLSLGAAMAAIEGLLTGLTHVHGAASPDGEPLGLVHRDVNPSNVLVTRTGAMKLIDLGVARMTAAEQTTVAGVKGTLGYMAPEQLAGRAVDRRADLYAAGLVMYELLTGVAARPPGAAGIAELIAARARLPAPPSSIRADVPPDWDAAILAALAPDPGQRPADATELLARCRAAGIASAHGELAVIASSVERGAPQLARTVGPQTSSAPARQETRVSSASAAPAPRERTRAEPAPAPAERVGAWVAVLAVLAAVAVAGLATFDLMGPGGTGPARLDARPAAGADAGTPEAALLAPDSAGAIVTDVEARESEADATDGGPVTSRIPAPTTPPPGQDDTSEPAPDTAAGPGDGPAGPTSPAPTARPRVEFRGVGQALYVKGPGAKGLAPQRSRPFSAEAQVFVLGTGETKATVRLSFSKGRFVGRIQGSGGTAFDDVTCGGRSHGPSARLSFRRSVTCTAVTAGGASMHFTVKGVQPR